MTRILSLVFVALVAAGLYFLPEVPASRLAALEADSLFDEVADADGRTLAELVLAGPAVAVAADHRMLVLGGVRVSGAHAAADPASAGQVSAVPDLDLALASEARRSVVRALRQATAAQTAAGVELLPLEIDGELAPTGQGGAAFLLSTPPGALRIAYAPGPGQAEITVERPWSPASRKSLVPPFVAIVLAILFRRPVLALFVGVLTAGWLRRRAEGQDVLDSLTAAAAYVPDRLPAKIAGSDSFWGRIAPHLPDWITVDLAPQLADPDRAMIIAFVVLMLAMVGIVTRAGGIRGLMDSIAGVARGPRSTQVAAWLMGLVIFFDDYANTILVGATMRPLSDRFKLAREKLAYIVDSTAAPVAGLSVFSTWIAFEVSTYSAQLPAAGLAPSDGYQVFLESLPFRFYSILTLVFVGLVAILGRDLGPMLKAERRARHKGELVRVGGKPLVAESATDLEPAPGITPHAAAAIYPILTFLVLTLFDIARSGGVFSTDWRAVAREGNLVETVIRAIGDGSGTRPLVVGSAAGLWVAMAVAHSKGMRPFRDILRAALTTLRSLGIAIVILYLAWMIGAACQELSTASYLTALLGDRILPQLLPALLFVMAAVVAFSTGSSWSTMSILLPLVVGLAYTLGQTCDLGGHALLILSIGAVLEGAIFGDHCSPISDTTVLSSTASASDHIDHVRTQAPYAILTMLIALGLGYLPCAFMPGWRPAYALVTGALAILAILLVFGRSPESEDPADLGWNAAEP